MIWHIERERNCQRVPSGRIQPHGKTASVTFQGRGIPTTLKKTKGLLLGKCQHTCQEFSIMAEFEGVRIPQGGTAIYKDECVLTFDNAESDDGLFVCMKTFLGFCKAAAEKYAQFSGCRAFLHIKTTKTKKEKQENEPPQKKPTKMAIGGEDGFDIEASDYEYHHAYQICVLPEFKFIGLDDASLPANVQASAAAIIAFDSSAMQNEIQAWEEVRRISKHATGLTQLNNGVKVPPSGYKCAMCDLTDNLWMNLTDGTILCGRKFFDGSGGNNHAVEYYQQTKYPLAVKLGTITADGADVYSYDEDDMVLDPNLAEHLAHFGIDVQTQKKTSLTMAEMEINANQQLKFEFDKITEAGQQLDPCYGPGYTGMLNLGNSCYMNSVMQVLLSLPEVQTEFAPNAIEKYSGQEHPEDDLQLQFCKLQHGLMSGAYSQPPADPEQGDESVGVRPTMFKQVVGKGHSEFSKGGQQDAMDFWQHTMTIFERYARQYNGTDLSKLFQFDMEVKTQCTASQKVKYLSQLEAAIQLPIELADGSNVDEHLASIAAADAAKEKGEKQPEIVPLKLSMKDLLTKLTQPTSLEDWYSPAIEAKTTAIQTRRFKTFPKYLLVSANKFYFSDNWLPKKRDISLDVPDELDLTSLKGQGQQPDEELLPEDKQGGAAVELDQGMIQQLQSMGFAEEGCKRAVYNNPTDVEAAMNWIFAHMEDADFATPFVIPGSEPAAASGEADPEAIMMIVSMGFTEPQAKKALKATNGNVERAADWIFSHMDELDKPEEAEARQHEGDNAAFAGSGKYCLKGFISHMGSSAQTGHYICHIKKDGQWVIFNDRKVAKSKQPPREFAYLYLYESV
eukprot:TRINITY_DN11713_c0_g1_i2.p1 TRINITY_DN11713_c0_g1~~TRINITY_DN11713_c0_g1_i2.p1  ORF type:complete len:847 (+),score=243.25 TRINITY_DN11713_c0_g1_i2:160-2700(+)